MATTTEPPRIAPTPPSLDTTPADMVVTLDVGPGGLDGFLALVRRGSVPRIKYREGSLTLVSPSRKHERGGRWIDELINAVCDGFGIDSQAINSTLLRKPGLDQAIEPDFSYYIEHEPDVRGVEDEIDLSVLPPPDLAVEVVYTHGAETSLAVCAALRIPEVWVYRIRKRSLEFLVLGAGGRYAPSPTSRSFPFLTPADVLPWVEATADEPDRLRRERLREWVRDVLGPRTRPAGEGGA